MIPFQEIPLVDSHLHPMLRSPDVHPFARYFTEADDEALVRDFTQNTLFYRRAIRDLSALLDCAPNAESVERARGAMEPGEFMRLLVRTANVKALLVARLRTERRIGRARARGDGARRVYAAAGAHGQRQSAAC
jgi:hypothetical protein